MPLGHLVPEGTLEGLEGALNRPTGHSVKGVSGGILQDGRELATNNLLWPQRDSKN